MRNIKLTLIIPAYNEEKIIKRTVSVVLNFLLKKKYGWEVIVVDDGSSDSTYALVSEIAMKEKRVKVVRIKKNSGKGTALRVGISKANGEYIVFSDADLSVPIKNVDKFIKILEKDADVVIGSRRVEGAEIVVHQPWLRENMGRFYTFLTKVYLSMDIADFTCGFKGFKKQVAKRIFKKSLIDRWAYDSEIMFLVKKYGYEVVQTPVVWRNREDTRVNLGKAVAESFRDLLSIRVNELLGKYNSN